MNNLINIDRIYIAGAKEGDHRKSLKSIILTRTNNLYKNGKIPEASYREIGGSKTLEKTPYIKVLSDQKNVFPISLTCHKCKRDNKEPTITENDKGFECYASVGQRITYTANAPCKVCKSKKHSFFNITKLPPKLQSTISENLAKSSV